MRDIIITSISHKFDQKVNFFEVWFKFNYLELALGMALKFYTSLTKVLIVKVRRFLGLIPTLVEVTRKKQVRGGDFLPPYLPHPE